MFSINPILIREIYITFLIVSTLMQGVLFYGSVFSHQLCTISNDIVPIFSTDLVVSVVLFIYFLLNYQSYLGEYDRSDTETTKSSCQMQLCNHNVHCTIFFFSLIINIMMITEFILFFVAKLRCTHSNIFLLVVIPCFFLMMIKMGSGICLIINFLMIRLRKESENFYSPVELYPTT
jgi:hypothetical protein